MRHDYKFYNSIFEPLGYKVLSRDYSLKVNTIFDLYAIKSTSEVEWFGSFNTIKKKGNVYYQNSDFITDSPKELVEKIKSHNDMQICPSYCYAPIYTPHTNLALAFKWYLTQLDFVNEPDSDTMVLKNMYGENTCKVKLYCDYEAKNYHGEIIRYLTNGLSFIKTTFNSVDSMIGAINSIIEPELLIDTVQKLNIVKKMTDNRDYSNEFVATDNMFTEHKINMKNTLKVALKNALEKIDQ